MIQSKKNPSSEDPSYWVQRCTHKIFLISPITKSKFREIIKLGFREIFLKFREIFAKQEVEFFLQIFREF